MWNVSFHSAFVSEFSNLPQDVKVELVALSQVLATYGPSLGRPRADTLKGSRFANMKELRFQSTGGPWRVAYAFDPARQAILLVAGMKGGQSQTVFYRRLIATADQRFEQHLKSKGLG